jgi:hypothetical protein
MLWRDQQRFYDRTGWVDQYLLTEPAAAITPSPVEAIVERYLREKKNWRRDEYRLESRGGSADGRCDVIAAIHVKDRDASFPGTGHSVEVSIDRSSHQVAGEAGAQ